MPKKSKIVVQEPEPEPVIEEKAEEIKISKRTGKPVRPLTALQMETLRKGRELAVAKRKQLIEGVDLEKRASDIKKAKDELKLERDTKQQLRLKHQKKITQNKKRKKNNSEAHSQRIKTLDKDIKFSLSL